MKVLFFAYADQRKDLPNVKAEANFHKDLFANAVKDAHFYLHDDREATKERLAERLTEWRKDIVLFHFSGHAGDKIIELEESTASAAGLAHLLAQCTKLELIILNGCCTVGQINILRAAGVQATIIATNCPVEDKQAYEFSRVFYKALHEGEHCEQAFEQGIGAVQLEHPILVHRGRGMITIEDKVKADQGIWAINSTTTLPPESILLPGSHSRLSNDTLRAVGPFFGRKAQLERLVHTLDQPNSKAIAITGEPGIGKSSLCLKAMQAPELERRYGNRRFFVSCEGANSAPSVVLAVANVLGVAAGPQLEARVLQALKKQPFLIAFDNAETPMGSDDEADFEHFLATIFGMNNNSMILTIRGRAIPTGLDWEKPIRLQTLSAEDAQATFLAVAQQPELKDDPNLNALLLLLDGLPLALTLMGYQAQLEDHLATLLQRWKQKRTAILQSGQAKGKQKNLATSLELSLQGRRISAEGLRLYRTLSLLPDGIHRSLLHDVFPDHGLEGASNLIRVGLAFYLDQRLKMLAPIREYGVDHYPPSTDDLMVLVEWINQLAALGDQAGRADGAQAIAILSQEIANLEYILPIALEYTPEKTIERVRDFIEFSTYTGLGDRSLLAKAYKKAKDINNEALEANCIRSLGDIAFRESNNQLAEQLFNQAIPLYEKIGSLLGQANCIRSLGKIAFIESNNQLAEQLFNQAIPLYEKIGSLLGQANCYWSIGDLQLAQRAPEQAKQTWLQALAMYTTINQYYSIRVMYIKLVQVTEGEAQQEYIDLERAVSERLGIASYFSKP
ncbi:MAG: tetratricopeptide repeat protein [Bacteroidota bacterium]